MARDVSEDAADRFAVRVSEALAELREGLEAGDKPHFDADASIYFSRKTYLLLVRPGRGRRRRAVGGAWRVLYELADRDGDGEPDTVRVLGVYHGAARPLGERVTEDAPPATDEDNQTNP